MNLNLSAILKGLAPFFEPIGEQGVQAVWATIDAEIAKLTSPDAKDILTILSPAFKQCVLVELQKLKN